jgi:hypothetical protein
MRDYSGPLPPVPGRRALLSTGEAEIIVQLWNDFRAVILQQPREQCQA